MKKRVLGAGVLSAMMLFSPIVGGSNTVEASTQLHNEPIMWGQSEVSPTQIGRIVFLKEVKLYKRGTDNVPRFHLNAKKGSMWRVHNITNEGGKNIYDLGGGVRVQQSDLSRFERVPALQAQKQVERHGAKISWVKSDYRNVGRYPQVSRLASKDIEDKINNAIQKDVKFKVLGNISEAEIEYSVMKNKDGHLMILSSVKATAEETGDTGIQKATILFDLATGEMIEHNINVK